MKKQIKKINKEIKVKLDKKQLEELKAPDMSLYHEKIMFGILGINYLVNGRS